MIPQFQVQTLIRVLRFQKNSSEGFSLYYC